jgi:predicted permease
MRRLRKLILRLGGLFNKQRKDRELDDEIESHLQSHIEDNLRLGMTPEKARRQAMIKLGGIESTKEAYRDQRGLPVLETLIQDVRYGARMLRKNPGFTAVAVLTLALGIGANTAIFTVINSVLLRSLPVRNPDKLVQIVVRSKSSQSGYTFSYPFYEQLRDGGRSLSELFAAGGVGQSDRLLVPNGGNAETEFVRAQPVSGNFFSVLGVPAILGRTITAEDDRAGNPQTVTVISYSFWQRRFGGDPSVVGRVINFNDVPFIIVGVTPAGFFGFQPGENPELWWPLQVWPQISRDPARLGEENIMLRLIGRLAPGVERPQAQAELAVVHQRYLDNFAASHGAKWTAEQRTEIFSPKLELRSGHAGWTDLRDQLRQPLFILMAVVGAVLLISCANVASLLLARAAARTREFSVRSALGAGRLRLARQLLTESLLLAALGGLLGLLLAQGGTRLLQSVIRLPSDPTSLRLTPDIRVMLFTSAATLSTGMLFGLAPALRGNRIDISFALKDNAGSVAAGAARQRFHQSLIVAQVALSLVLLIGAGLFVRTLRNLKGLDAGFNRENLILFNLHFTQRLDAPRWAALYKELLARLESLPGIRAASLFGEGYLSGYNWWRGVSAEGYVAAPDENLECAGVRVGPKFFETFGTPLLAGREFGPQDERPASTTNSFAPATAIINQAMARRYFGNNDPLGRRIVFTGSPEKKFEIVGVVPDAKNESLRKKPGPTFFVPFFQEPDNSWANFALRTSTDVRATMTSLSSVVQEVDRTVRVSNVRTMNEVVNASVHQELLIAQMGGFFSVFALALACLGLYGVLSFAVVQRTREIGVRVALGAQRRDVLSLVIGKGLRLTLVGCVLGLIGAFILTRLASNLLYGVTPTDPMTFLAVTALLIVIATLSSWVPARRAAKVDPTVALRYE